MRVFDPVLRWTLGLCLLALGGCVSLERERETTWVAPPPTVEEALPYAVSLHRFELPAEGSDLVGALQVTRAEHEDTFVDLARRFNVGYEELVRANPGVDPWLPREGREIVLPTQHLLPNAPRDGVVINLAAMRLYYFPKVTKGDNAIVYTFPIGIGRVGWATPIGTTRITRLAKNPTWRPGPGVRREHRENGEILPAVVPAGPDNPLGTRAMYLGWTGYLIHGTNKPAGVGLRSSHGCIRLFPEDVEFLYDLVGPGTKVTVVNQPFVFGWHEGQLLLQAFDVLEDDPRNWKTARQKLLTRALAARLEKRLKAQGEIIDWAAVSRVSHEPRGVPLAVSRGIESFDAVVARATRVRNALPIGANWQGELATTETTR
ncbi:MAG: L,D-transpeptidase family protein [Gammaproteobacteria bacterium]|jgi:L,D-transpeptidase ErfK/SrfK|nr:L,D-transpeptidase family protein [Gammaproteobacteria bacterium]